MSLILQVHVNHGLKLVVASWYSFVIRVLVVERQHFFELFGLCQLDFELCFKNIFGGMLFELNQSRFPIMYKGLEVIVL